MSRGPLRRYLWDCDPKCHWCDEVTELKEQAGGKFQALDATIDHYFSKYHQKERSRWGNPVVLACYRCNHDRGAKETAEQPIEELWRRSQNKDKVIDEKVIPRD